MVVGPYVCMDGPYLQIERTIVFPTRTPDTAAVERRVSINKAAVLVQQASFLTSALAYLNAPDPLTFTPWHRYN